MSEALSQRQTTGIESLQLKTGAMSRGHTLQNLWLTLIEFDVGIQMHQNDYDYMTMV